MAGTYTPAAQADPNAPETGSKPDRFPGTGPAGVDRYWWKTPVVISDSDANRGLFGLLPSQATKTVGQMLLDFDHSDYSVDQIDSLQQQLYDGGFYGKKSTFTPGERDTATRKAFISALKEASREKVVFGDFLTSRAQARADAGLTGPTGTPNPAFVAKVTSPDDLRMIFREATSKALGQSVDDAQISKMIAAFQGKEVGAQRSQYDATYAKDGVSNGPGGTIVAPPDPQVFADLQAKIADPTAYDSRKVVAAAGYLEKKLRGQV